MSRAMPGDDAPCWLARMIGRMTLIHTFRTCHTCRTLCITLAITGASFGTIAAAATTDAPQTAQYTACMDRTGTTTVGMIDCADAENKRQDVRLNAAYKALIAGLPAARKTRLQDAQRAWIKYRDANCAFYVDPDGGSMARIEGNLCVMTSTTERANELERFRPK